MKELSIEEKAQRYDEAIKRARNLHKDAIDMGENIRAKQCEIIFPEIKESEDKRIRKSLSAYFAKFKQSDMWDDDFSFGDILAWLEKQGEQKSVWSEVDEIGLCDALWAITQARTIAKDENDMGNLWYAEDWLKSLRERYTWKPSDEQMENLSRAFNGATYQVSLLRDLYLDLKKLREE